MEKVYGLPNLGEEQITKLKEYGHFPKKYIDNADWNTCKAENELSQWLDTFKVGKGLLIHGPVGTGKTMAMCLIAQEIYEKTGIMPRFVYWSELISKLSMDNEKEFFELIKAAPLS